MDTPKLQCNNCKREYPKGYMVKSIEIATEAAEDLCMWCSRGTTPPSDESLLEYPDLSGDLEDFGRGLPGMSEQDYE